VSTGSSACDDRNLRGVDVNTAHPTERSRAPEARPKVAVVQAASVAFDLERTLRKAEALAADAASQGARRSGPLFVPERDQWIDS
jgi:hypothetical protein